MSDETMLNEEKNTTINIKNMIEEISEHIGYDPIWIPVWAFHDMPATKEQGIKILEEASECREAYDRMAKYYLSLDQEVNEDIAGNLYNSVLNEACDTIQATVNLISVLTDNDEGTAHDIILGMIETVTKNGNRGYYEKEETDGE